MNRKRKTYDRYTVGIRIQDRRISLGLSQEALAERMDRATKYCSDIERGVCGMSVETMLSFSEELNMSLDYMMYGVGEIEKIALQETLPSKVEIQVPEELPANTHPKRMEELQQLIEQCTDRQYAYALQMLKLLMEAASQEEKNEAEE